MLGHSAIHTRIVSQFGGKFVHYPRRVHRQTQRAEIHSAGFTRFFAVSGCSGTPKPFGSIPIFVVVPTDEPHFKHRAEFGQRCGLHILQKTAGQINIRLYRLVIRNLRRLAIGLRDKPPFQILTRTKPLPDTDRFFRLGINCTIPPIVILIAQSPFHNRNRNAVPHNRLRKFCINKFVGFGLLALGNLGFEICSGRHGDTGNGLRRRQRDLAQLFKTFALPAFPLG